jgi:hypothetical protein
MLKTTKSTTTTKAALIAALALAGLPLHAVTWLGGEGDYNDPIQWDMGFVPLNVEDMEIAEGTATHAGNLNRNALTTISGTGSLVVNGRFVGGGSMNVSGGGMTVNGNYFLVGSQSRGTFLHSGGTVNATLDRGFFLSDNAGGAGSEYHLTGGTLNVISNGTGSNVDLYSVHIGKGGANDLFVVDGGTAEFAATVPARNVWISRNSRIDVLSGSMAFEGYESFTIGRFGSFGGLSELSIGGGEFSLTNLVNDFTVGFEDNGLVTLSGGEFSLDRSILLGGANTASGSFQMSGGTLTAPGILAGSGAALFSFTGGEIFLQGDQTTILHEPWFEEVTGTAAIYSAELDQTRIAVVPEPSVLAMTALPLLFGMLRRRR